MVLRFIVAGSIACIITWLACAHLGGPFAEVSGSALILVLAGAVVAAALVSTWKVSLTARMVPAVIAVICGAVMTILGAYGYAALFLSVFIGSFVGFVVAQIGDHLPVRR